MTFVRTAVVCEIAGAILGIAGGWLVSGHDPHMRFNGFLLWVLSDLFLIALGIILKRKYFTAMMVYYTITSIRGMINS